MRKTTGIELALVVVGLLSCGRGGGGGGDDEPERTMIQNKGSDTMVNLAQAWAEEYRKNRPNVAVAVTGGGSGTGIAALQNGTVDVANSSREIKDEEATTARKNTGKAPVEHLVAFDALAVYVHPSNPLTKITKAQIAAIYGENGATSRWSDLGVEVPGCSGQEIVRVSRQNNSGTYQYFREWALDEGDFKLGSRDMQGSKDVVDLVETTPCAIGYSGIGYRTDRVKALCVSAGDGECTEPTPENTLSNRYPISRGLYMYTLGEPTGEVARYLDWIRSDAGQAIVDRSGYVPIPADRRRPAPE
jgi:phosphate transport system substrate-binding protein